MPTSYSPESDSNTERFLLIKLENDSSSDFAHITAYVVRAAKPQGIDPDSGRDCYNDGPNAAGYRNCSYTSDKKSAYYVEDLQVHSQISKRNLDGQPTGEYKPYGIGLRFKPYCVELREATNIYSTLTRATKKLEKLDHEFGYGERDLATFITRVASVFGIKKFLTYGENAKKGYGGYGLDSGNLKVWNAKDVDWIVSNFIKECNPVKAAE
jgi:hypothetical protein